MMMLNIMHQLRLQELKRNINIDITLPDTNGTDVSGPTVHATARCMGVGNDGGQNIIKYHVNHMGIEILKLEMLNMEGTILSLVCVGHRKDYDTEIDRE